MNDAKRNHCIITTAHRVPYWTRILSQSVNPTSWRVYDKLTASRHSIRLRKHPLLWSIDLTVASHCELSTPRPYPACLSDAPVSSVANLQQHRTRLQRFCRK